MNFITKIKAGGITNLTDARYFSAMGVEYLGIDLDLLAHPIQDFLDISQWVEGPIFIAESLNFKPDDWMTFLEFTSVNWTQLKTPKTSNNTIKVINSIDEIKNTQLGIISPTNLSELVILSTDALAKQLIVNITGIALNSDHYGLLQKFHALEIRGSLEEKVGYKSYDELDNLFNFLEKNTD